MHELRVLLNVFRTRIRKSVINRMSLQNIIINEIKVITRINSNVSRSQKAYMKLKIMERTFCKSKSNSISMDIELILFLRILDTPNKKAFRG